MRLPAVASAYTPCIFTAPKGTFLASGRGLALACAALVMTIVGFNPNYQWSPLRDEPLGADFLQEWTAGNMIASGAAKSIYSLEAFNAWQHDSARLGFAWSTDQYYPAVYPPSYYALVSPLGHVPYRVAVYLWLVGLVSAYAVAARWSTSSITNDGNVRGRLQLYWIIALLLPATFLGLVLGQKGTLWLAVLAASFVLFRANRPVASGVVAALLTLKPTLALVIPLAMLLNRQWRFVIGFVGGAMLLGALSLLVVPVTLWWDYAQVVAGSAGYQTHGGYHSGWSTSLMSLFKFVGLHGIAAWALYAIALVGLVSRVVVWQQQPLKHSCLSQPEYWLLMLVATALLSPHAYFYDLVWMLVPLCGIVATKTRDGLKLCGLLWICMLVAQSFPDGPPVLAIALVWVALARLQPGQCLERRA